MKPTSQDTSFPRGRALVATTIALLIGTGSAFAQSSGTYGTGQKNPSGSSGTTSSSTDSTRRDPSASATGSTSGTTGSSYGTGSSTYNSGTGSTAGSATGSTSTDTSATAAGAPTGRESTASGKLSWGDRRFVTKSADSGMSEVQIAQLATQQASNSEVKSFAQTLVDDHTKVNDELKGLASQKNVKLDDDTDQDRAYKKLAKKSGAEFDQEFVEHMIDGHEASIKRFEEAAKDAKDSDIRAFASKHIEHLRGHLQKAQSLKQTLMPTGRDDGFSGRSSSSSSDASTSTPSSSKPDQSSSSSSSRDAGTSSTTSGSTSSGTTGSSADSSSATTPKRDGSR